MDVARPEDTDPAPPSNSAPVAQDAMDMQTYQRLREEKGLPPDHTEIKDADGNVLLSIQWQTGPLSLGRNGVTLEDLIRACYERLGAFNETDFKCRENSLAITSLQDAENWLDRRTRERQQRGVEGQMVK